MCHRTFSRQRRETGISRRRASYCNRGLRSTQCRFPSMTNEVSILLFNSDMNPTPKRRIGAGVISLERRLLSLFLLLSHLHLSCICPPWPLLCGKTPIPEQDKMGLILTCKKGSALCGTRHLPTFIALQI